jgi:hypothetical protein
VPESSRTGAPDPDEQQAYPLSLASWLLLEESSRDLVLVSVNAIGGGAGCRARMFSEPELRRYVHLPARGLRGR